MLDLGFFGPSYTWCNGQLGCAQRWARLDRFLANLGVDLFKNFSVSHLKCISSDHAPLLLNLRMHSVVKKKIFCMITRVVMMWLLKPGGLTPRPLLFMLSLISCVEPKIGLFPGELLAFPR